ncbi:MAG TPA: hypothetical protein VHU89_18830 [Acidobacteriaceae bacterium]|jgi:hypothetical protein|nr:hypothetical protein [Acidobacteriaceae bacterium]
MSRWAGFLCAAAVAALVMGAGSARAQDSDFNLDLHANGHATAKAIGLPAYPGATPYKEKDDDSGSADLGMVLNSFHFRLQVASYVTQDAPDRVLAFYRKPLARYGEVLECDHGKPVGSLKVTRSGLTCGDKGHVDVNGSDSSTDHELRAGTPQQFRIVAIDNDVAGQTKFGLVALELPKDAQ